MSPTLIKGILTGVALALTLGLAGLVIVLMRRRLGLDGGATASALERVLIAQGAARCMEVLAFLRALGERGDGRAIADAWFRLEAPLLQALPDCPPALKAPLGLALETCAQCCDQRSAAKSMMDLRRALLS